MRAWTVGGAIIEDPRGHVLLVENLRRNGTTDWTPPGGVIEVAEGEVLWDGLAREVLEETGLIVTEWEGPLWRVRTEAPGLGWVMTVEVHRATAVSGELTVGEDPDGIVIGAEYLHHDEVVDRCIGGHAWVHDPLVGWLRERWTAPRDFAYHVAGERPGSTVVTRLS